MGPVSLLHDPHHDGSPLYVDRPDPGLGETVTVRVRVPHRPDGSPGARTVVLRSVRDGEPYLERAEAESSDEHGTWWAAPLLLVNPVTSYRFLVSTDPSDYRWLNGSGVHAHDVTDAADFGFHDPLAEVGLVPGPPPATGVRPFAVHRQLAVSRSRRRVGAVEELVDFLEVSDECRRRLNQRAGTSR